MGCGIARNAELEEPVKFSHDSSLFDPIRNLSRFAVTGLLTLILEQEDINHEHSQRREPSAD